MARATTAEKIFILIAFLLLFWQLSQIRSQLSPREVFTEVYVERSTGEDPICQEKPKPFPRGNFYLTSRYHAVAVGGGLGNQLFELISIVGIASSLGRTPMIAASNAGLVNEILYGISNKFPLLLDLFSVKIVELIPFYATPFNERDCCRYVNVSSLLQYVRQPVLNLDGYYFQSFKYFDHLRADIRRWLTPLRSAVRKAKKHLPEGLHDHFIVCTHVRRGDFTDDGVHKPSDPNYTRKATDFLAKKYAAVHPNLSVVVLGNDPIWAQAVFYDSVTSFQGMSVPVTTAREDRPAYPVVVTSTLAPEVDLAFSGTFCDVVLITAPSSTFGWWLAYLSKPGATVYYRDIDETMDRVTEEMSAEDFYPPDWMKLKMA